MALGFSRSWFLCVMSILRRGWQQECDVALCRFDYTQESRAAIEARLGLEIQQQDVEMHKKVRPTAVRCWGSRSNSCNSDESDVLQIDEGRSGAFASAVTKGCVRDVKLHPVIARFKIISLKSIICIGFLRSVHNAAQPSVARDLLELRPSEMGDLCACRSNGERDRLRC